MSSCARNRWGSGTTSNFRPHETASSREMEERLKAYQSERAKLDTIWTQPQATAEQPKQTMQTLTNEQRR
jgi:hypothetical protein